MLGKKLATFCLCLGILSEVEFKSNELYCSLEVSEQLNVQAVAWLLLAPLTQIYSFTVIAQVLREGTCVPQYIYGGQR